MRRILAGVGVIAATVLGGSGLRTGGAQPASNTPAYYTEVVKPVLMTNCGKCHFNMNHKGGLAMDTKALMMKGGRDGAVVVPGNPDNSMLVKLIRHEGPADDPKPMPPKSPKMSDADIAVVANWIKAGAVMPSDPTSGQ